MAQPLLHNIDGVITPQESTGFSRVECQYEVVRGLELIGAKKKIKEFMLMYEEMVHLQLDMKAINKAVDIYLELHKGQQIEDNDIYIAAIAMVNGCTLVTANEKHFSRIEGLTYANWRI